MLRQSLLGGDHGSIAKKQSSRIERLDMVQNTLIDFLADIPVVATIKQHLEMEKPVMASLLKS